MLFHANQFSIYQKVRKPLYVIDKIMGKRIDIPQQKELVTTLMTLFVNAIGFGVI